MLMATAAITHTVKEKPFNREKPCIPINRKVKKTNTSNPANSLLANTSIKIIPNNDIPASTRDVLHSLCLLFMVVF